MATKVKLPGFESMQPLLCDARPSFNSSELKPVYLFDDYNNNDDNNLPHGDFVKVKCVNDYS